MFALWQLEALGLGASSARRWARQQRLHRVHQAVYALVPPSQLTVPGRYLAAVLACTGGRARSAVTAGQGPLTWPPPAHERRPPARERPPRSPTAPPPTGTACARRSGAHTLLDLAAVIARRPLEQALDRAEILRVFDLLALADQLDRNPRHPGAGLLQTTLATHTAGEAVTDSELEEPLYASLARYDLPRPTTHGPLDPGHGGTLIRPDFSWRAARLALEVDGRGPRLTRKAFESDRRRDQRLTAAGWRVIRVTWRQLNQEPERIARLPADLLAADVSA